MSAEVGDVRTGSRAIERAMTVLDCFAGHPELSLSDVAGRTGLPVSTVHRILGALVRGGFVERLASTDTYRIGGHVSELVPDRPIADEVSPHLYALAAGIKIAVSFGVLEDNALVTIVNARPPVRYCAAQIPGDREPLHATAMGKALLAFDPSESRSIATQSGGLISYTPRTRTTLPDLLADLRRARQHGFALSDEERTPGVRGVAVPVFGSDRAAVGAIGVQARSERMTDDLVESLVPILRHFAREVGKRLGDVNLVFP